MTAVELLLRRARRAAGLGHHATSARLLAEALALATDPDTTARVEITRAYLLAETGDPAGGIERCESLLGREGLSAQTHGRAWQQLGLLHMRSGSAEPALAAFGRAIELLPADVEDRGFALLNRGNVHLQLRRPADAARDFQAARDALDVSGLEPSRAKAEHNLGYARMLTGDLVGAMRMIDEAALVLAPLSAVNRATIGQDRAEVLTAAGRPRDAVRALEAAAAAYGSRRLRTSQAECELTLAWTLLREDVHRARLVARRAARRFRGQASPARARRADAVALLAALSEAAGPRAPTRDLRRADLLVAELREDGATGEAVLVQLQAVRAATRVDPDDAGARLRTVRITADAPVTTRLLGHEVRAGLAAARGHRRRALEHVRAGLADLHTWQSRFGSLDLQSSVVAHGRDLARAGLELALDGGDPATLLEWSERARALVARVTPVHPPHDPVLAEQLTRLRTLPRDHASVSELRREVAQRQWYDAAGPEGGSVAEPVSLDGLQTALDGAALVAPLVVRGRLHTLVLTESSAEVVDGGELGPLRRRLDALTADLTMLAAHRSGAFAEQLRGAARAALDQVAAQVVGPLLPMVGDRRVVLTPSGALAGTPWGLLPGFLARPLTIPVSATRWVEQRGQTIGTGVTLVAGPGVARGEEEVSRAAGAWPDAELLCGDDATSERVAAASARVGVLHLAGHGRHSTENPLFSAVELADGAWFGYDIERLPRTPSVVVLSACELGRASVRSGEEAIGMTAAWLHAGTGTVLSSPVVVNDDVACEAMTAWHGLVATGTAPAVALAEVVAGAEDVVPVLSFGAGW